MNVDLNVVKGVGDKLIKSFRNEGIWNTYDLVSYIPKGYENFFVTSYEHLKHKEVATVIGKIIEQPTTFKKQVEITKTTLEVDRKTIRLIIFNRGYLVNQLEIGAEYLVKGSFNLFKNEMNVLVITKKLDYPEIKPIYRINNIPDTTVSKIISEIYNQELVDVFETLPIDFLRKHYLYNRKKALKELHQPESRVTLEKAMLRFKMEEALIEQLKYFYHMDPKTKRTKRNYQLDIIKNYIKDLPFQLTLDQQEAVNDIYKDFKKEETMYRLLQGDVGSGKTIVAFLASIGMITAGYQVAIMAPTELLANQHYTNFNTYFKGVKSILLTGSTARKKSIYESIERHKIDIVFGTHALSNEDLKYAKLGLVVIDEQHKFGVDIRHQLIKKGEAVDVLYLTATPIPRSLFMTYFGDLEASSIKMKPSHRKLVETVLISDKDQLKVMQVIKEKQMLNEQSFIVVPAIQTRKKKYTIETVFGLLETTFNHDHIYVIHGKLNPAETNQVMLEFMNDSKGILLSTTMIEVGIDIKCATTMAIFGAEHFGLSQLHQLRGRIGRGDKAGTCYLLSGKEDLERLEFLASTNDGFILSEYDLKLRGPGVFSDFIQSGKVRLNFLNLTEDQEIILKVKEDARAYAKEINRYPYLKKRIL